MLPLGFSLQGVGDIPRVIDTGSDAAAIEHFIDQTVERRAKLQCQLEMADEFLALLRSRLDEPLH